MDHDDIASDLQSLKKLYGLLRSYTTDTQAASTVILDESTLIFLKQLLDGATEKILGAHSESTAARSDAYEPIFTTQISPHVSETSLEVAQNSQKTLDCDLIACQEDDKENEKSEHIPERVESVSNLNLGLESVNNAISPIERGVVICIDPTDDTQSKQGSETSPDFKEMNQESQYDIFNPNSVENEVLSYIVDHKLSKPTEIEVLGNNTRPQISKLLSPTDILKLSEKVARSKHQVEKPKLVGTNVKAMVDKIESLSRLTSPSHQTPIRGFKYVQGLRLSTSPQNMANMTPDITLKMPTQIEKESQDLYLKPQNDLIRKLGTSSNFYKSRIFDKGESKGQKKILPCRIDIEDASSSSVAYSSWTSGNGNKENSLYDTQSDEYVDSTSYPDSESNSFPSCSDSEADESHLADSESSSVGSINNRRWSNTSKEKQKIGRLRRLKDKLALIFHHHHHHHHHHHDDDDDVYKERKTRGKSLWKNAGKLFNGKNKTVKYREKPAEKVSKSVVHKSRKGHFHALVKGLMKHVKNSKKSKPMGGGVKRVGRKRGSKKGVKKSQWLKILRQQRAVRKMPRTHPKLS